MPTAGQIVMNYALSADIRELKYILHSFQSNNQRLHKISSCWGNEIGDCSHRRIMKMKDGEMRRPHFTSSKYIEPAESLENENVNVKFRVPDSLLRIGSQQKSNAKKPKTLKQTEKAKDFCFSKCVGVWKKHISIHTKAPSACAAITAVRPAPAKSFERALVENVCGTVVWLQQANECEHVRETAATCLSASHVWPGSYVPCAPDHASICCAPVPGGCCRAWAWSMGGPGWLLAAFADSDREAGLWVMEFGPAESESHWQTLAPHGRRGEVSAHSLSLPPCGRACGTSGHTHGHTQADTDTVTRRPLVKRNLVLLGCCNLSELVWCL